MLFLVLASLTGIVLWFYVRPRAVNKWCWKEASDYWQIEQEKGRLIDTSAKEQVLINEMNKINQECLDRFGVKSILPVWRMGGRKVPLLQTILVYLGTTWVFRFFH